MPKESTTSLAAQQQRKHRHHMHLAPCERTCAGACAPGTHAGGQDAPGSAAAQRLEVFTCTKTWSLHMHKDL